MVTQHEDVAISGQSETAAVGQCPLAPRQVDAVRAGALFDGPFGSATVTMASLSSFRAG